MAKCDVCRNDYEKPLSVLCKVKDEASGLALTSTRECAQVIDEQTQPRQAEGQTKDAEGGTQDNAGWQMIH
jgi:hypothetical protein